MTLCAAAVLVAALCYQGLDGEKLPTAVALSVGVMDAGFLVTTALRLAFLRPRGGLLCICIFSAVLIIAGLALKVCGMPYGRWSLVFWDVYVLLLYFGLVQMEIREKRR